MKKIIFPVMTGILTLMLLASCGKDSIPIPSGTAKNEVNEWIYETMRDNYLWEVEKHAEKIWSEPPVYFDLLKNPTDNLSVLWETTNQVSGPSYDIGFEYAANKYNDGKIYYVIYYVKPGSQAELEDLKRGYLITKVNGKEITNEEEAKTLLKDACKDGKEVKLTYMRPPASVTLTVDIVPKVVADENPVFTSTVTNLGNKKVGYLLYNKFIPGDNGVYDAALAEKMEEFYYAGISHLVLDLRYNPGGALSSAGVLGSALVKNRSVGEGFITHKRRDDLEQINPIPPVVLTDKTASGTTIPKLGDNLEKIYIITGAYTAGVSEIFINAIKAYRNNNVIIVGEKTAGSGNISISNTVTKNEWSLAIALSYMSDRDGQYNYANGFTPDLGVADVSKDTNEMLEPLGSADETIYKAALAMIRGGSYRSVPAETESSIIPAASSISNKSWANKSIVDLDYLR